MIIFNKLLAFVLFLIWIVVSFILIISVIGLLFIFDDDSSWLEVGKRCIDVIL